MKSPALFSLRSAVCRLVGGVLIAACARDAAAQTYAPPGSGAYGSSGPNAVYVSTFSNPAYPTLTVSVYHPGTTIIPSLPTIFFAHGLTSYTGLPSDYSALLNHLASQGYNVVFSPYEGSSSTSISIPQRFDELTSGFDNAVTMYKLNTLQVGFVGHSFGAGFLPAIIRHEMMGMADAFPTGAGNQWGATAAFMFSMAPAYAYDGGGSTGVSGAQAIAFPGNLNVVVQYYNDDQTVTDARLAIDIFYNITTSNDKKDFNTVYGDSHGIPAQVASHYLPATNSAQTSTSLQAWAVFRHVDALAAYTFTGDATAQAIALGNGAAAETTEGAWSDGVPVKAMGVTDLPRESSYFVGLYQAQWNSLANPRLGFTLAGPPQFATTGMAGGQISLLASGLLVGRSYIEQTTSTLGSGGWTTISQFNATQTTQTFTHAATNTTPQFWRILAQ